ncbi:MAG: bifunctional 5,10-methylenetetrahydrofolate dehydrogenase/5,10-methenyltetrahydrofolate cyclohydrolase [candidate division WOR-3 bacterium]
MNQPLILDGKKVARVIKAEIRTRVAALRKNGVTPKLGIILIGDHPPSLIYVANKEKSCREVGIEAEVFRLPEQTTRAQAVDVINRLNDNPAVHGIIIQLPVPPQLDAAELTELIQPQKDVDGLTSTNLGRLVMGNPLFIPATPAGIKELLHRYAITITGRRTVIVGRGLLVGKPLANLLLLKGEPGDATVIVGHSRTIDLASICKFAEILVVAIGSPNFVTGEMVTDGVVVVDAGINRTPAGIIGDVHFESVAPKSAAITPVPGGVGPMTVAMLLVNTVRAAELNSHIRVTG